MDIEFIYPEIIEAAHEEFRAKFEPLILDDLALPEVHAMAGLTLRVTRLAIAGRLIAQHGLKEESQIIFRSAVECVVNLLFILEVGPKTEGRSRGSLAAQFLSYADIAYYKALGKRPERARRAFKRRWGMTDEQVDAFLVEKKALRDEALKNHGCRRDRWYSLDFAAMAREVRDGAPAYVHCEFADFAFTSLVNANSAVHGDALSLRSQAADLGNQPLEVILTPENTYADMAGWLTVCAWSAVAAYYGEEEWLNLMLERHMGKALWGRRARA